MMKQGEYDPNGAAFSEKRWRHCIRGRCSSLLEPLDEQFSEPDSGEFNEPVGGIRDHKGNVQNGNERKNKTGVTDELIVRKQFAEHLYNKNITEIETEAELPYPLNRPVDHKLIREKVQGECRAAINNAEDHLRGDKEAAYRNIDRCQSKCDRQQNAAQFRVP